MNATTSLFEPDPLEATTSNEELHILIVDDYVDNRLMLAMLLRLRGIVVLEAGNGREGVEIAQRELPQLVLMDLSMPVMDGFEATRQLKAIAATHQIPVVAISAHCGDLELHRQALEAGCEDCFAKPFNMVKLDALLKTFREDRHRDHLNEHQ